MLVLGILLLQNPTHAACDTASNDTGGSIGAEDCDGDGYEKRELDCNDYDPDINPGQVESCELTTDENCDGFFNENCERTTARGTLVGGSACGNPTQAWLLAPLPFLLAVWRRRRAR